MPKTKEYHSDSHSDNDSDSPKKVETVNKAPLFSTEISKILKENSTTSRPVLSRKRGIEKTIDDEKLMEKARKILKSEKHSKELRVVPQVNEHEKELKKIATKGVVQLFNALRQAQKSAKEEQQEKEKERTTKKAFLDSIKQVSFLKDDFVTSNKFE
jgi:transposase-like protein